jgi:hypothetical protein
MRPRDFLDALDDPSLPRCAASGERADILRSLLVQLFFVDLNFDKRELLLLARVLPDIDVHEYVKSVVARRLDLDRIAALFPDPHDRLDIVTLAEHAIWGDDKLEHREADILHRLADKLGVLRE